MSIASGAGDVNFYSRVHAVQWWKGFSFIKHYGKHQWLDFKKEATRQESRPLIPNYWERLATSGVQLYLSGH
jgi:hypothetical protein